MGWPAERVVNGMPKLSRRGLESQFVSSILIDPTDAAARLNHLLGKCLLGTLPKLVDQQTGKPFEEGIIPRECFPLVPDPELEERRGVLASKRFRRQAEQARMLADVKLESIRCVRNAFKDALGGWRIDSNGYRYYQE